MGCLSPGHCGGVFVVVPSFCCTVFYPALTIPLLLPSLPHIAACLHLLYAFYAHSDYCALLQRNWNRFSPENCAPVASFPYLAQFPYSSDLNFSIYCLFGVRGILLIGAMVRFCGTDLAHVASNFQLLAK